MPPLLPGTYMIACSSLNVNRLHGYYDHLHNYPVGQGDTRATSWRSPVIASHHGRRHTVKGVALAALA